MIDLLLGLWYRPVSFEKQRDDKSLDQSHNTDAEKNDTGKVTEEQAEEYMKIFQSYMHVFLDNCARQNGYRDLFEYREANLNPEARLLDVSRRRGNEVDVHPWWECGIERRDESIVSFDGIPVRRPRRILIVYDDNSNKDSLDNLKRYLIQNNCCSLIASINVATSNKKVERITGTDTDGNTFDYAISLASTDEEKIRELANDHKIKVWVQTGQASYFQEMIVDDRKLIVVFKHLDGTGWGDCQKLWRACQAQI